MPGSHHITQLIVKHYHHEVKHQERHFTHGRIRAKGYWIVGGKRLVSSVIRHCVKCRKLRAQQVQQKMADLPTQRLTPAPPFTFVGVDVFGPWQIVTRRTRGEVACNKRWAVIFTCLSVRAIHIELIESLDTSSFINALRRFLAIRGPVTRAETWVPALGGYGATLPDKLGGALVSPDKNYSITIKLITITLYF